MNLKIISSKASKGSLDKFWKAMNIWLKNPHLVNRRISSSVKLSVASLKCDPTEIIDSLLKMDNASAIFQCNDVESTLSLLNLDDKCIPISKNFDPLETPSDECYLLINKYLPRDSSKFSSGIEFNIIDGKLNSVFCYHRSVDAEKRCLGTKDVYKIHYDDENEFCISVEESKFDSSDPSIRWLRDKLFFRLLKWTENDFCKEDSLVNGSLNLVSVERYTESYKRLKEKYGPEMVKKWPECTDPNKFVYEDIAIATYLILLWEKERNDGKKQSFVDLGCGNGLLVYILSSEGYSGLGIDLRKRQIWEIYPETTRLEEKTFVPSSSTLFPEVDWIIGNHSDELTPWIPVIASRSSYNCRFFLLPCCAHEFDGRKFQRDNATKSQYFEYLKYVRSISETCGFKTDMDKLRIPSTKRICLVGTERTYVKEKTHIQDKLIDLLIDARSLKRKKTTTINDDKKNCNSSQWAIDFKPREMVEKVRNCTQIEKTIIDEIINVVACQLIRKVRNVTINNEKTWNAGGIIKLSDIAKIIAPETLKKLRNECGGLQTLLRNNSHIFCVIDGSVQFRVPGTKTNNNSKKKKGNKSLRLKIKPCWFYKNHPDGCPVDDEICTFKH